MDQQNPTLAKIPILDTRKFKQWQFRIQKYLQHEHYALWEVIEFGDSYKAPGDVTTTGSASDGTGKKKGRIVTLTTDACKREKAAILKTFGGNETTKKTKKNLLKQQYRNFKAKGSETLEQTFNRLGNEEVNIASGSTTSINVSTATANIGVASISQDTACAYIASQIKFKDINQIDKDDMEEMDIKWNMALLSMRANRAPKIQDKGRRDNYRQGSKVEEHAPKALMAIDRVGWDWSYVANNEENHALIADEETPREFALMAKNSAESEN
nr:hypothetical protein [Tanacetum cinerariifolium]